VRRILVLGVALLAIAAGVARGGGPAAPLPLPCGLPQVQPLWVDYADGMVPFWSTIFARPGIVGAASNFLIPPQLRARGAQTVYFDLYMNNRVGTPSKPADPSTIQARADKLFDTAVTSSGCDHPLLAENELFGAQLPTPWTPTTSQYRANVLTFLQRLAERGARPFLLLSSNPYTHDATADDWWRQAAQVADLVPEVYFSGPAVSAQGAVQGSRRLRATMRSRLEKLIEIGVPTNRLGMMLTFSSTPKAGGREGLSPLSKWLDVVKWEGIAAKQVSSELHVASVWSWGWAAFNPAGNDPDKPKAACTWLWTRDHSLCDAPALAGKDLDTSLDVGATLPAGTLCVLDRTRLLANDVAALTRLTGDRDPGLLRRVPARGPRRGPGGRFEGGDSRRARGDPRPLRWQPRGVPGRARAGEGNTVARPRDPRRRAAPPRRRGHAACLGAEWRSAPAVVRHLLVDERAIRPCKQAGALARERTLRRRAQPAGSRPTLRPRGRREHRG